MPHINDNILLAAPNQPNKRHTSIVEMLSTPPLLPRSVPIHLNNTNTTNNSITTNASNNLLINNNNNITNTTNITPDNIITNNNNTSNHTTPQNSHATLNSISLNSSPTSHSSILTNNNNNIANPSNHNNINITNPSNHSNSSSGISNIRFNNQIFNTIDNNVDLTDSNNIDHHNLNLTKTLTNESMASSNGSISSMSLSLSSFQNINGEYCNTNGQDGVNNMNNNNSSNGISHSVSNGSNFSLTAMSLSLNTVHQQNWQFIKLSQLIESNKLIFINSSISVEDAFNTLVKYQLTSLPVQTPPNDLNCLTFDYNDLNSYLLLVLNKIKFSNEKINKDCQNGASIQVGELIKYTPKDPFFKLSELENLSNVINILGSGVHRIAITDPDMTQIRGILSQRRLIKYLWDNARQFPDLEPLLNMSLKKLKIGIFNDNKTTKLTSRNSPVISINGDEPLINALYKMHSEKISSIAVIDSNNILIGNISVTDVKHLTRTSQYPLLQNTCRHFISIILNNRGLENGGKDSFPIFHVYPSSSLARTIAKLVATKSHRLWIVQPSSSTDPDPDQQISSSDESDFNLNKPFSPHLVEKDKKTGKLIGVISLTDILSILARNQTQHKQVDPQHARRNRK
ncbi:cell separation during budding [Monosporozyma unispora]|nr:cell separation during budding [Kazachstania unispora]